MAAARCRVPKALLLLRTLAGKRWSEADLFHAHLPRSPDALAAVSAFRSAGDASAGPNGVASRRQARPIDGKVGGWKGCWVCALTTSPFSALLLAPHTWLALCAPNPTAFISACQAHGL